MLAQSSCWDLFYPLSSFLLVAPDIILSEVDWFHYISLELSLFLGEGKEHRGNDYQGYNYRNVISPNCLAQVETMDTKTWRNILQNWSQSSRLKQAQKGF